MTQIEVSNPKDRCPYCRDTVLPGDAQRVCSKCLTRHHEECWSQSGRCAVFGCENENFLLQPDSSATPAPQKAPAAVRRPAGQPKLVILAAGAVVLVGVAAAALLVVQRTPTSPATQPKRQTSKPRVYHRPQPLTADDTKRCAPVCGKIWACSQTIPEKERPLWLNISPTSGQTICLTMCASTLHGRGISPRHQQQFQKLLTRCKITIK